MKKIYLLIIMFLVACRPGDGKKIANAYQYILENDSLHTAIIELSNTAKDDSGLAIYDSLVFMETSDFTEQIAKFSGTDFELVLDSLTALDKKRFFKPYTIPILKRIDKKPESKMILFFSKPYKNTLLAEVVFNYNSRKTYNKITHFNQSLLILFFFDKSNNIENVLTTRMHYN